MTCIELKNVTYTYPLSKTPCVSHADLVIEKGKFYAVIGANGSGKTTLCNIIRGFIPEFYQGELEGSVILDGKNLNEYTLGELAPKIGYVFQNPFNQITGARDNVYEEIAYGLENLGIPVDTIRKKVEEVMEITNTVYLAKKNPFELSGGQQQRVALASVLALEPDIFVIRRKEQLAGGAYCMGAPEFVIEIVSLSSSRHDYELKRYKYQNAGVKEYWIVDYEKNLVMVYDFQNEDGDDYTFSDTIPVGIYPDLEIDLSIINK